MDNEDDFWADDPYADEDEDDPEAYEPDEDEDEEILGFLAGDYAENGMLDLFGALDFDLLDIHPDDILPF